MEVYLSKKFAFLLGIMLFVSQSMTFANSPNHFISYTQTGHSTKPAIILIHAFPTDKRLWTPQQDALKQYFNVISLDLWGFGKSSATNGQAVTMETYAAEVKQLMDQLHLRKAIIAGESMGGYVALAFLKRYPDHVSGLVLSDTQAIADSAEAKTKREATAVDVLSHGSAQLIHDFMPKAFSPNVPTNVREFLQLVAEDQPPTGIASALRGMAEREDMMNLLSQADLPILIITGDQDVLISPEQSANMHATVKQSKLVMIANAGHLSNLEQPEQWNKAVIEMFGRMR